MPNTGSTPTQTDTTTQTGSTSVAPSMSPEQQAAANAHDRAEAKDRLTFGLADSLLPILNQQVTIAALRYYIGLGIDQVLGSPDGLLLQGSSAKQ